MSNLSETETETETPQTLTILSYNVGLLRLKLFGLTVFSNPPHAAERLPHIPEALRSANADIIFIQECYEEKHAKFLTDSLKESHPYVARVKSGGFIK
jgi:mRNA deadenylase 3'-5' endonuclease subunit Ccr4